MERIDQNAIPCLPENAPFTAEQRAYLNGFFAGLFSRAPVSAAASHQPPSSAVQLIPLSILFGSQTGNGEKLAKRAAKEASKRGFAPTVHDLATYPTGQLASEERVLIISSTYGDGEAPDNAKAFWEFINGSAAPNLTPIRFSLCALGDSNYPKFCAFGKHLDLRLEALGGQRIYPCAECDVDFEETFQKWLNEVLAKMRGSRSEPAELISGSGGLENISDPIPAAASPGYSRSNPFLAELVANQKLNAPGSDKDTRHFEIALHGSELTYEAGDVLGVIPTNCQELVEEILSALGCSGAEPVPGREGVNIPFRESLLSHYEIAKIPQPFFAAVAESSGDTMLKRLAARDANGSLSEFLRGREIIDLPLAYPAARFAPAEFVRLLKKLHPRLYSISSSLKAHPGHVHLTVNIVRYESLARKRKGVCSTFLAERVSPAQAVPVFIQRNENFRPPSDNNTSIIMVGPGTGIAPFRAFLQERHALGARGRNWLFFGNQRAATDFLYRDELQTMHRQELLTRLDTAFSRDQPKKIYVQHRMREHAKELFVWLDAGAHFYVCGDGSRMAKDVDGALHQVIQEGGGRTLEQAAEYVNRLKAEKRYQRDVY
jgi:sulfite reductase (NADPH) flavoprotein alpha-component